jgi:hypothetical protein
VVKNPQGFGLDNKRDFLAASHDTRTALDQIRNPAR